MPHLNRYHACDMPGSVKLSTYTLQTDRPTDRLKDRQHDRQADMTDSNQKTDRMTESTVKSTYFVPAVKYRGGEWWVVMGWGQEARLLSGIGNTNTQICPMYHN